MSVLRKTIKEGSENVAMDWRKFLLPGYIVLSALFILYSAYSYLGTTVYQTGLSQGQLQGYEIAKQDLFQQAGNSCDPITVDIADQQLGLINIACLQQQAPVEAPLPEAEGQE